MKFLCYPVPLFRNLSEGRSVNGAKDCEESWILRSKRRQTHKGQKRHKDRTQKHIAWGSCFVVKRSGAEPLNMSSGDGLSGGKGLLRWRAPGHFSSWKFKSSEGADSGVQAESVGVVHEGLSWESE